MNAQNVLTDFYQFRLVQVWFVHTGKEPDMEIGPDEEMPAVKETAKLLQVVRGEEDVERMDALLSLAVTGGDYNWM